MKLPVLFCGALALATGARAVTATGLSSFEAIEETLVRYYPQQDRFERDEAFQNIVELGGGAFRFIARHNAEWWDGDRDTPNKEHQRMEVKGLGPHQRRGETFIYTTTWRSGPGFNGGSGLCHLFQLRATNGDGGAPLITLSIRGDKAAVEAYPDGPKVLAREFSWKPAAWQRVEIRVRVSPHADGELLVSVDGDVPQGRTGLALARPEADAYRPKWGLYRRAARHPPQLVDDFVEHKEITARRPPGDIENAPLELEARALAGRSSVNAALRMLEAKPPSPARDVALASIVALWAEQQPAEAMRWAEALPAGALRRDALARIFSRWADADVAQASAWLTARAPRAELDLIAWLFVTDTTYRYVNRPVALAGAALISEPALRANAFLHVLEIWARSDRPGALVFLEKTPALTAEQKLVLAAKLKARAERPE